MAWDDNITTEEKKFYKITRFRPDTCGCVLTFAWDTRTTEDNREHIPVDIENACPAHAHYCKKGKDVCGHHADIIAENQHKNIALGHLLECLDDEHCECVKDTDGNEHRVFKRQPTFRYNDKRELEIDLGSGIDAGQKRALATKVKSRCGERKVHIK